jgi:putative transposase
MRLLIDAILYVLRTGCAWAHLPPGFPPPSMAHRWFLRLARTSTFESLAIADRQRARCKASPRAAVLDVQSARFGGVGIADARAYDVKLGFRNDG